MREHIRAFRSTSFYLIVKKINLFEGDGPFFRVGASEGIRTLDIHVGNVTLYQTELRSLPESSTKLQNALRIASPFQGRAALLTRRKLLVLAFGNAAPSPCTLHASHRDSDSNMTALKQRQNGSFRAIDPRVRIGHVHLKVSNLQRALAFYCDVLGFELTQRYGTEAAFISAGGYHHHIGLNTWESLGGSPPSPGTTGLFHLAILYPERRLLADALKRLLEASIPLDGASDHGVSEALYLRDPDQNGVELYWDRLKELWPRTSDGKLAMTTEPLDLEDLLATLEPSA